MQGIVWLQNYHPREYEKMIKFWNEVDIQKLGVNESVLQFTTHQITNKLIVQTPTFATNMSRRRDVFGGSFLRAS